MAQVVEFLPSKLETLNLSPSTEKTKILILLFLSYTFVSLYGKKHPFIKYFTAQKHRINVPLREQMC
jgi:hypothetical protein